MEVVQKRRGSLDACTYRCNEMKMKRKIETNTYTYTDIWIVCIWFAAAVEDLAIRRRSEALREKRRRH